MAKETNNIIKHKQKEKTSFLLSFLSILLMLTFFRF